MAKHSGSGVDQRAGQRLTASLRARHRNVLSLAIATALALPGAVHAQAAPAADAKLEEVVVTGIRASIASAVAVKEESMSIVEAISAEDIGKLPDTSIAESISRLPGLTSQRAEGRASAVSLRGTDPGFTTTLMNGREQVSTGDNRSIEYDQYPSELIGSVVVYKTPDAQLMGQGLAGTIDLRTVRPLDYDKRAVVLNLRGEKNSNDNIGANSDDQGYRASFSYIDQYMDGKLGLAIGYAHLDSPLATRGFGTYDPWNPAGSSGGPATCGGASTTPDCFNNPGVAAGQYATNGMKVRADMGSTERDGVMASLQYEPSDFYHTMVDVYYSTMDQTNNARSIEVNNGGYPAPCCDGQFPAGSIFGYSDTTIKNGTVVAGTLNHAMPLARNFLFLTNDEIVAAGWRNEFTLNDTWSMVADVSYSDATREQDQFETQAQYVPGATAPKQQYDTGTFQLRGNSNMPTLSFTRDYADPTQVFIGPTIYGAGYTKAPEVEDELTSFRLDATRTAEMGWFDSATFGVNYADRSKDKISPELNLATIGGGYYQVEDKYLIKPMDLNYADTGKALAWNVKGVLGAYFQPIVYADPTTPGYAYLAQKYWSVDEKVWTGFVRGDLSHDISDSVTMRGNVGLQIIRTDQSSSSFLAANGGAEIVPVSDGKTYTDYLPQVNVVFSLPASQAVRFGVAKEMARPRMDQLKATEESGYNTATGEPSGNGGNPKLDPWRAWAFDASYEKYFANHTGYVSAAAFYKDLTSYIYDQTDDNHDFSDLLAVTPPSFFPPGSPPPQTTGSFKRPVNGNGGYLYGFELSASTPFDMFSEALDGFGAILSYSYTKSDIEIVGAVSAVTIDNITLPGLSEDVWNATLYYEKYGFGARIATRYRSEYIGEVTNFANDRGLRYVDSDMITDAQVSYLFGSGTLEGLQVLFQVNNVTNEPYIAYSQDKTRVLDYQEYGTQYLLGLNYRF